MKKYALLRYCLVFLAIVLPYFSAATINGPEMVLAERVPDMEEYLPGEKHTWFMLLFRL